MDFLDDVRPPDKPYSDVLCNTYINENIDEDLKNALEASIELENQKKIKEFDKNKKINLLSGLDKIYNIYKFENKDEDLFFIECLQNSIQSYLDEKIKHIELFKAHYLKFNEVLETYYTKHIEYKRKPKINEELYIFLKKKIKSI